MEERNKIRIFIYGSMIIALTLGIYGQSISYYVSRNVAELQPLYYLTVFTITSILLFLIPPILIHKLNKKQKLDEREFNLYYKLNIGIGTVTSLWSLFILIMWWG